MYKKSLDIKTRIHGGDNHLDVAKTRENMAIIYQNQGHYDQALEIYKSVLETKIRVCGHEHPDVAASYNNIGMVYDSQGKYEEALEVYARESGSLWPSSQVHTHSLYRSAHIPGRVAALHRFKD